jgi:hypothetical protein
MQVMFNFGLKLLNKQKTTCKKHLVVKAMINFKCTLN